jgi:hypothetical protein
LFCALMAQEKEAAMTNPSPEQVKELLIKQWMTHDAMWLAHCMEEVGMEAANRINRRAVRSMALIETKRLMKLLGIAAVNDFQGFQDYVKRSSQIIVADFMGFAYSFPAPEVLRCEMKTCFAYDGMKRLDAIEEYQCGIFTRIEAWLEALGISYTVEPQIDGCMMLSHGRCYRQYSLTGYPK